MCHMNRPAKAPFPLALPVIKHTLFGFVLPFDYKIEHFDYKIEHLDFAHFSRSLFLRWVSINIKHGSIKKNIFSNLLLHRKKTLKPFLIIIINEKETGFKPHLDLKVNFI